jgi:hypothetical protein
MFFNRYLFEGFQEFDPIPVKEAVEFVFGVVIKDCVCLGRVRLYITLGCRE